MIQTLKYILNEIEQLAGRPKDAGRDCPKNGADNPAKTLIECKPSPQPLGEMPQFTVLQTCEW